MVDAFTLLFLTSITVCNTDKFRKEDRYDLRQRGRVSVSGTMKI